MTEPAIRDAAEAMKRAEAWQKAVAVAARAHHRQFRKDGRTPYIAHVYRVTMTVRDLFGCDDIIALAAALLHDTIEDTERDYDDIEIVCGTEVADVVAALSKDMRLPEPKREEAYDAQLARGPWQAKLIKLADTYDNYCDQATAVTRPTPLFAAISRMNRALAIAGDDPRLAAGVRIVREAVRQAEAAT